MGFIRGMSSSVNSVTIIFPYTLITGRTFHHSSYKNLEANLNGSTPEGATHISLNLRPTDRDCDVWKHKRRAQASQTTWANRHRYDAVIIAVERQVIYQKKPSLLSDTVRWGSPVSVMSLEPPVVHIIQDVATAKTYSSL
ncbi:hypothetical protein SARC_01814 [Sphaeroforma arctica JP610]|uniref:Uncharacterized protein n=1 Tax=Sphaeroforma arctica JP610 TaxID=667725 RepID=A0A0L0GCP4_9EUKA|nr:hypothetical protein SARC_01814 [Sphaeroforma arctica JP610]KNC86013.1 hypothetical protein SARC_01814 [Sphaeroforma arctica JP610]|eukprot:XP_014159915.1 hypothetical protein SARC_01814 [Sphaeroforma arctica JP610]